uniref:DUF4794 domain-containing protein n=1 Tax=Anopheles albimanus TaxID=7167 RepID=A0A182FH14_ANOAL
MAASQNARTLFQLVLVLVGVLIAQTEAGLLPAATPLVAAALPQQLYARSAYSQVVGRVFDARNAPNAPATRTTSPTIVSAFGSPAGIRLVGLPGIQSAASNAQQNPQEEQTNVEIARGSGPAERAATGGPLAAASNQEAFGAPLPSQPSPFNEYGVPAPVATRVNP